jgi:transforming growth factor-beta-induced protein
MRRLIGLVLFCFVVLLAVAPATRASEPPNIVEIAVADGRFTTLVAAVVATDLAGPLSSGQWTVFAPTDEAFAKLGLNAGNITSAFSRAELTDILLYHAVPAEVTSARARTLLGDVTMANGQRAGLKYFMGSLYVNDDSKVIIPDIAASNGVIHAVDTVILGPWPRTEAPAESSTAATASKNIVEIAVADGRFTTLVAAVVATDLAGPLSSGQWTVFAPTDEAFAKLGLNAGNITSVFSLAELTDILLYHAVPAEVTSARARTLLGDVTMANGQRAGLKYFMGSLYVNDDSKVIIPDIAASNGVIHAVDTVILGPWPR